MSKAINNLGKSVLYFSPCQSPCQENLLKIQAVFAENAENINLEELESFCFSAVLKACKKNEWGKIEKVKDSILGLQDTEGKSIYEVLIEEGELDCIDAIQNKKLFGIFSNLQSDFGLHIAARKCQTALFAFLVDKTPSDAKDIKGKTPIHIAISKGQQENLDLLLVHPKNQHSFSFISQKLGVEFFPISYAVYKGNIECLDLLLGKNHPTVSLKEKIVHSIGSLLHIAIQFGGNKMLRHLLTKHYKLSKPLLNEDFNGKTPLMLAAELGHVDDIQILCNKGADLEIENPEGKKAIHFAILNEDERSLMALISKGASIDKSYLQLIKKEPYSTPPFYTFFSNLIEKIAKSTYQPPNYLFELPEILVFKGGGPPGIAEIGAFKSLEETGLHKNVKRVAGTSAGAINATLIAMGLSAEKIVEKISNMKLTAFFDHCLTDEKVIKKICDQLNSYTSILSTIIKTVNFAFKTPQAILLAVLSKLGKSVIEFTGVFDGDEFQKTIESIISNETKISDCTFGELRELINKGNGRFKHLHIFATKVGTNPELVHFSTEDERYKDYIISDVVTASMSIPFAFKPRVLRKKVDGKIFTLKEENYLDGGMIGNFAINAFDTLRYASNNVLEEQKDYPIFNRKALGFSLYAPENKKAEQEQPVTGLLSLLKAIGTLYFNAEELLLKTNSYNQHRIIEISNCGISLLHFNVSPDETKELLQAGDNSFKKFLKIKSDEYEELCKNEEKAKVETAFSEDKNNNSIHSVAATSNEISAIVNVEGSKINDKQPDLISIATKSSIVINRTYKIAFPIALLFSPPVIYGLSNFKKNKFHYMSFPTKFTHSHEAFTLFFKIDTGSGELRDKIYDTYKEAFAKALQDASFCKLLLDHDNANYVDFFIKKGILNIHLKDENGFSLIHYVIWENLRDAFSGFLEAKNFHEPLDDKGTTILHLLIENEKKEFYEILEQRKLVSSFINVGLKTPLMLAIERKNVFFTHKLLAFSETDFTVLHPQSGKTLLHLIYNNFLTDLDLPEIKCLFHFSIANIIIRKWKEKEGSLEKMMLVEDAFSDPIVFKVPIYILNSLIKAGIAIDREHPVNKSTLVYKLSDENEHETLKLACEKLKEKYPNSYQAHLDKEIKILGKNRTALVTAAKKNNYDVIQILLETGANFWSEVDGYQPFEWAPWDLARKKLRSVFTILKRNLKKED